MTTTIKLKYRLLLYGGLRILLILALMLYFSLVAFSAKMYDGYIIKNDQEKLVGKIKMISPSLNEVKVKFISKKKKLKTYKAKYITEYGFWVENWDKKSKKYDSKKVVFFVKKWNDLPFLLALKSF